MLHDSLLFFVIYRLNCVPLIDMSTCTVFWSRHYFRSRRDEMYMDVTQYSPLDVYKLYKTTEWRTLSIYWQEPQLPISWHNNTGHTKNVNELIDNINRTAYHWHVPYPHEMYISSRDSREVLLQFLPGRQKSWLCSIFTPLLRTKKVMLRNFNQ